MAQRVKTDWFLFYTILSMVCFGLVMVYSASSVVAELKFKSSTFFVIRAMFASLPIYIVFFVAIAAPEEVISRNDKSKLKVSDAKGLHAAHVLQV